jgi:hypothetical protein
LVESGRILIDLPMVEDAASLAGDLTQARIAAVPTEAPC